MSAQGPVPYQSVEQCVDDVIEKVGKNIVLGLPLGLGKPNQFVNELYRRAKADPSFSLMICTALSLEKPTWSNDLERRFLEPFVERLFSGYIDLEYLCDLRTRQVPSNITVKEFYTKAGAFLNLNHVQQNYISSNYTHAYRDILDSGVNVIAQMVCKGTVDGEPRLSLSCNPDVTLDVAREMRRQQKAGKVVELVAQVNQNLPFMYGDAVVEPALFTRLVDNPDYYFRLFGAPKMAVSTTDFWIGLYSSMLMKDGGTLQIGIGSLGDALCYGLKLRHQSNDIYQRVLDQSNSLAKFGDVIDRWGGVSPFEKGLLGSTEMLVDGYLDLIEAGIIKRKSYNHIGLQRLINQGKISEKLTADALDALVEANTINRRLTKVDFEFLQKYGILRSKLGFENGYLVDGDDRFPADLAVAHIKDRVARDYLGERLKNGILVYGGFFLGPESFYQALRDMSEEERRQIFMTSVLNVNQLYENQYASEELKRLQRKHGRFVNACLMVTLAGAAVSDGLENYQIISGVGGQYNFVSQAHALPEARSLLMCRSTRTSGRDVKSNIVFSYGHMTIPKHLRDIIVTEYGIADLRGKTDQEIIAALLHITDSRYQRELLDQAKRAGKISRDYEIPDLFQSNYPERLEDDLAAFKTEGYFPAFPFGTDFTEHEITLGRALRLLKAKMSQGLSKVSSLGKAMAIREVPEEAKPYLERLQLDLPSTAKEKMMQRLVIHALSLAGTI